MKRLFEEMAYGSAPDAGNFWRTTLEGPVAHDGPLHGEARCDIAIIGAGYTGLNAALVLAEAGADVRVLEEQTPGFGASGRNGGFCCLGGAHASEPEIEAKHSPKVAQEWATAQHLAVDHVAGLLERFNIQADVHSRGETLLAHRPKDMAALRAEAASTNRLLGVECEIIEKADLAAHGMNSEEFHGAMTVPIGFGMNPLKYLKGLCDGARAAGAVVHGGTQVSSVDPGANMGFILRTPSGVLRAKKLIVATNGYSSDSIPKEMSARFLPVPSNVLVTRPLTGRELQAQGWTSTQMCYDSRRHVHYFRLMPDPATGGVRMLFGLRGGTRMTQSALQDNQARTRAEFDRIFPEWSDIPTPHFWSGLLCASRNLTPFVGDIPNLTNGYAAFAYQGNGVAMGSYAGTLVADLALGRKTRNLLPWLVQQPPGRFPLGKHRRAFLPASFHWDSLMDRI